MAAPCLHSTRHMCCIRPPQMRNSSGPAARSSTLLHSAAPGGACKVKMAMANGAEVASTKCTSAVEYRTPQGVRLKESEAMLPGEYVWPEGRAPRLAHDEYGECEIPVIDVGGMMTTMEKTRRVAIVEEVRKACQEWGFFQIVNHGFSTEMLARVERECGRLFSLPLEEKLKSSRQPGTMAGYGHAAGIHAITKPWSECFGMRPVPGPLVADHAEKLFQGNSSRQEFRECFEEYEASVSELAKAMGILMCEGLGIASNHFDQYRKTGDCLIRLNYYAPCPEPLQTIGLGEHSDPNILTLLHQGDIGGLQVMKDGQWIAVRPQSNAFVVNVGDGLQAVSNGIYRSVRHRAVVNKTQTRLSHAYFFLPDKDEPLCPAAELVTSERPAQYRPFSLTDLLKQKYSNTDHGEDTIDHFLMHPKRKP